MRCTVPAHDDLNNYANLQLNDCYLTVKINHALSRHATGTSVGNGYKFKQIYHVRPQVMSCTQSDMFPSVGFFLVLLAVSARGMILCIKNGNAKHIQPKLLLDHFNLIEIFRNNI